MTKVKVQLYFRLVISRKGIETGIKEGVEKGKIEEKQTIAKAMLSKGLELEIISELTSLSIAEIENLK